VTGKAWYGELYDEPGVRRSITVWLLFGVPSVLLSKLDWVESAVWWLVLGMISLFIASVTVGIVQAASGFERRDPALSPRIDGVTPGESERYERGGGAALVASMTTWAVAWLLILSTLVPAHAVGRAPLDTLWGLIGLGIFGVAVLAICGAISAVFRSSAHGVHAASWAWHRLTGQDSLRDILGGHVGLVLVVIFSAAALTGWLWLLSQAMRLAVLYAGWSR